MTPRGLETLVVETKHASQFLLSRAQRYSGGNAACCWAVLSEGNARMVMRWITARQFAEALKALNLQALHLGTLLPEDDAEELLRATP